MPRFMSMGVCFLQHIYSMIASTFKNICFYLEKLKNNPKSLKNLTPDISQLRIGIGALFALTLNILELDLNDQIFRYF